MSNEKMPEANRLLVQLLANIEYFIGMTDQDKHSLEEAKEILREDFTEIVKKIREKNVRTVA